MSPQPPDGSLTFVGILLTAINGLLAAVSAMGLFILRTHNNRVEEINRKQTDRADELEKKHTMLATAHTETLLAQSDFITRDEMEQYLRAMEDRWDERQKFLHTDNVDRLRRIEDAINNSRTETREDVRSVHARIDEIKRSDDARRG